MNKQNKKNKLLTNLIHDKENQSFRENDENQFLEKSKNNELNSKVSIYTLHTYYLIMDQEKKNQRMKKK